MSELRGSLRKLGLPPLVQFLSEQGRTGCLKISQAGLQGEIAFDRGRVVSVVTGEERGQAALEVIALALADGDFVYADQPTAGADRDATTDGADLQRQLQHLIDVSPHTQVPLLLSVPHVSDSIAEQRDEEVELSRGDLALLLAVDGHRTAAEVLRGQNTLSALHALTHLNEVGILELDPPAAEPAMPLVESQPNGVAEAPPAARLVEPPARQRPVAVPLPAPPVELPPPPPPVELPPPSSPVDPSPPPPRIEAPAPVEVSVPAIRVPGRPQWQFGRDLITVVALTAIFVLALRPLVQSVHVQGQSMVPGLREGEFLLVDRVAYLHDEGSIFAGILPGTSQGALRYPFGGPRRGDVVVFNSPTQPDIELVKRVIGLPGENLRIQAGRVFVNETPLDEPYTAPGSTGIDSYPDGAQPVRVPDDSYFVLGDNRVVSQDSRQGWFVRADTLVGRAWLAYWPPSAWGFVSQISPTAVTQSGPATQRAVATAVVAPAVTPVPVSTAVPAAVPTPGRQAPATGPAIPLSGAVSDEPGWPSDPTGTAWFVGSSYHLSANRATQFVAIAAPVPDVYADVQVTAMFHKIGGPPGGGYGIIVRDEGPGPRDGINQGGRYYVAEVGDRGEVGIWRRENDHWVDLQPWTRSEAVFVGGTTNELTLRAQGSKLTFAVNGHDVSSVSDGALASGRVGAFVGGDFNEVILDRFTIEVPPAGVAP